MILNTTALSPVIGRAPFAAPMQRAPTTLPAVNESTDPNTTAADEIPGITDDDGTPVGGRADVGADRFYFRQLLSGLDFAMDDPIAQQMGNFTYLIGDRASGECVVVDPAYGVAEIKAIAEADGMRLVGMLVTHFHADHCGGDMMGFQVQGAAELLELTSVPVHIQGDEEEWITKTTTLTREDLAVHDPGDVIRVGDIPVQLIHTPGHTPGSQCFLVNGRLVSGDTLFLDGCGRTDLPGGDPEALYYSLTRTLARVPDDAVLYPGHNYSHLPHQRMGDNRMSNRVLRPATPEQWLMMFT